MPKITISVEEAKGYIGRAHNLAASQVEIQNVEFHPSTDTNELVREFNVACANGRKLDAIKYLREITGGGLKATKDFVDALFLAKSY